MGCVVLVFVLAVLAVPLAVGTLACASVAVVPGAKAHADTLTVPVWLPSVGRAAARPLLSVRRDALDRPASHDALLRFVGR